MSAILHPTLSIHPILLPQDCFTDRFGNPNAYVAMNPAMNIQSDGRFTVLVRCVNYRKFHTKQFVLYEHKSNTKYICLSGSIEKYQPLHLESCDVNRLQVSYDRPTYPTYWTGPEDIRFVDATTVLVNIPECHPAGQPSLFQATLDSSGPKLINILPCLPNTSSEKNWMPIQNRVIYSVCPLILKDIVTDTRTEIPLPDHLKPILEGYHGSTNGIPLASGEQLCLIHKNRERTVHRWLRFHPTTNVVSVSPEFTFFKHSYIEFPCSLSEWNHSYFIGLGVNDDQAMIVEVSSYAVQALDWI